MCESGWVALHPAAPPTLGRPIMPALPRCARQAHARCHPSSPSWRASLTARTRELTASLRYTCFTWHSTVWRDRTSASAISRLLMPSATRRRICCSRALSGSSSGAGAYAALGVGAVPGGCNSAMMRRAMNGSMGAPPRNTLRMEMLTSRSSRSFST